jgi:hypothetical protein
VTITQDIRDIAGVPDNATVWFWQNDEPRFAADGVTMISTRRVSVKPVAGHITVELEPGPAAVQLGIRTYEFVVPDIDATLMPLIQAGLSQPRGLVGNYVVNGGGIARTQKITESEYAALTFPDPETEYSVIPDPE